MQHLPRPAFRRRPCAQCQGCAHAALCGRSTGQRALFQQRRSGGNGVYCSDGIIYRAHGGKAEKLIDVSDIRIPGAHNVENYMAAFAATDGLVGQAACVQVGQEQSSQVHEEQESEQCSHEQVSHSS